MSSEMGHLFRYFPTYFSVIFVVENCHSGLKNGQKVLVYSRRSERVPRKLFQEFLRCSENDDKEDQTGNIPLPGSSVIRPVDELEKESSHHAFFLLFLMISEMNFATAGKTVRKNITRMYFAGSSFPR